ncbi:MAG: M48 family metalloprotease [Alphaproteobacteria bacterium]
MLSRRRFVAGGVASAGLAGVGLAGVLAGCGGGPAGGPSLDVPGIGDITLKSSLAEDIANGRAWHAGIIRRKGGEYRDARLHAYVDGIGRRIAAQTEHPDLPYSFTLIDSSEINAFATLGGFIYITRGLIAAANTEAELAAVIAHEAGHINARHVAKSKVARGRLGLDRYKVASVGQIRAPAARPSVLAFQRYEREAEREADMLGFRYMTKAGYDRQGMISLVAMFREYGALELAMGGMDASQQDAFSAIWDDHPRSIERVVAAARNPEFVRQANPETGREAYLNAVVGLRFGDDPSRGVVIGDTFMHAGHGFAFTIPEGFVVRGGSVDGVRGLHPLGGDIEFSMRPIKYGVPMDDFIRTDLSEGGRVDKFAAITAGGFDGTTGVLETGSDADTREVRVVAFKATPDLVLSFQLSSPMDMVADFRDRLMAVPKSLRRLTPAEKARIKPYQLRVARVRSGDTVAKLSAVGPYGRFNEGWFRLINNLEAGESLQVGSDVKVVTVPGVA